MSKIRVENPNLFLKNHVKFSKHLFEFSVKLLYYKLIKTNQVMYTMSNSKLNPICQYCHKHSKLVDGSYIYPHRPDLSNLNFYICDDCGAYVGCHKGTTEPLGCLANAELRKWKSLAHKAFDPLWKEGGMKRSQAYQELAEALNIDPKDCHIGMFSVEMCKKVYGMIKDGLFPINKGEIV